MNRDQKQFFQDTKTFFDKGYDLLERKNNDYANANPFHNVALSELAGVSVEQGIVVRMTDKLARLGNLLSGKEQKVLDEKVEDTLQDMANYSAILYAYLKSKK